MTLEICITGTGVPRPTAGRAGPGVLVRAGDVALQVDAGRATVLRLTELGVELPSIDALLVTHHHSDHLTGAADLVLTRWLYDAGASPPLQVVAPAGPAVRFVERLLDPWADDIAVRSEHGADGTRPGIDLRPFDAGPEPTVVWSRGDVAVSAVTVHHEPVVPAVAYRVDTPDGSVVVSGDTRVCDEVEALARGADVLVHEAARIRALAPQLAGTRFERIFDYHADSVELGALAARAGVPMLVCTHLIPSVPVGAFEGFRDDVREGGYEGRLCVAEDRLRVRVDHHEISTEGDHADV